MTQSTFLANDLGLPLNTRVYQSRENAFTGRGNRGEVLATLTVSPARKMKLRRIKVSLDAEACDVTGLQVRCDGNVLGSVRVKPGRISALMPVTGTLSPLEILFCFTPFPIRWTGAT
ncbi:MAG: hypothetical protein KBS72_02115 [Bacteroidales bacterium]|nr:hypothetical protein [Candidatus Cacconaster scatequi]